MFSHVHKELAHGNSFWKIIVVRDDDKRSLEDESHISSLEEKYTPRAFTLVELSERRVTRVAEIWVSLVEDRTTLKEEHISFECN